MTPEENKLQDDFIEFWDTHKEKLGLGNYSDEITRFWLEKRREALKKQREEIVRKIEEITPATKIGALYFTPTKIGEIKKFFIKLIQEI